MKPLSFFLCAGLSLVSVTALAQTAQDGLRPARSQGDTGHRPPPEALAACKSLTNGAACSFTSPRGKASGTCFAPEGKPLACRPAHAPNQPAEPGVGKPQN
jgi:hypothetical protein